MSEILLEALLDSLKIFIFVFAFNFVFSFIGKKLSQKKIIVPLGAAFGLIPQCGFSVIAAEKFNKKQISIGTIVAVFIATSDEALPVLFSNSAKLPETIILIFLKFAIAVLFGYAADILLKNHSNFKKSDNDNAEINERDAHEAQEKHHKSCCCNDHHQENSGIHAHLLHPLIHSLQTLIVVLVFNILFSLIVYLIGEDILWGFIKSNAFLAPLFSVLIALIPNCASSVIIAEMFITDKIAFGACLAGLVANAGIGLTVLLGNKEKKAAITVIGIVIAAALLSGYITCLICGF